MDVRKYDRSRRDRGNPTKTYSLSLPGPTISDLDRIRDEHDFAVRAWLRDLVLEHLPALKKSLGVL